MPPQPAAGIPAEGDILAGRVDVLTLAKITGHRDLSLLMNTYYRESAADVAKRLG